MHSQPQRIKRASSYWLQYARMRRFCVILLLGFASGLPLALTGTTLQAWFASNHIAITTIGFMGLVAQPYAYKFFWSPLIDRYRIPFPLLGRRRSWMLAMQLLLLLGIARYAYLDPTQHVLTIGILATLLAFCSATQDIAIDAYRTDILNPDERGMGAALAVAGYRLGMLLSGGLALISAEYYGWRFTFLGLSCLMLVGVLATCWAPEPALIDAPADRRLWQTIKHAFAEFFSRRRAWAIILFIVLYKLAEAFTAGEGSFSTVFLLEHLKFDLATVGLINKVVGISATMLGLFVAGLLLTRMHLYRALWIFGCFQALSNLNYVLLAIVGKNITLLTVTVALDNLSAGMGMAALIALIMSVCHPKYSATQFALLSAVAALPRIYVAPLAGIVIAHIGWLEFFIWTFILAIPALLVLLLLRNIHNTSPELTVEK